MDRGPAGEAGPARPSAGSDLRGWPWEQGTLKRLLSRLGHGVAPLADAVHELRRRIESLVEHSRRRARGDYEIDPYGLDKELFQAARTVTKFVYDRYFRVTPVGVENVPASGRALLVSNHSGVLFPWDGVMITESIWSAHPSPRHVRWLLLDWALRLPFAAPFLCRVGCVMGRQENALRLLNEDHLVGVFPEGLKGFAKRFRDRYRLARFGRGGFTQIAMRTRTPIIPVSVVGGEEIHPALTYANFLAKPLGLPYMPITPTLPWLGLLGLIPLPTKWTIEFGRPIRFTEEAPRMADDYVVVSIVTEKIRQTIQSQLDRLLAARTSIF
ncbi:MAG: acyltransferase family protein [Candidatus Riflebacteria bacterium]|nr:acyltransferase family protein [Candidatus Riflebacteria bacterium]